MIYIYPIASMGRTVYFSYIYIVDFYGINVGKYTMYGLYGYDPLKEYWEFFVFDNQIQPVRDVLVMLGIGLSPLPGC